MNILKSYILELNQPLYIGAAGVERKMQKHDKKLRFNRRREKKLKYKHSTLESDIKHVIKRVKQRDKSKNIENQKFASLIRPIEKEKLQEIVKRNYDPRSIKLDKKRTKNKNLYIGIRMSGDN